jgi:hypothetical protein
MRPEAIPVEQLRLDPDNPRLPEDIERTTAAQRW